MRSKVISRGFLVFLHDFLAAVAAWFFAYVLRFNFTIPAGFTFAVWQTLPFVLGVQALFFYRFGLYRGVWRFASLPDLQRILKAVGVSALALAALIPFLQLSVVVPRSVLVLDPILLVLLMGGSRFFYRAWKEHHLIRFSQLQGEPVLVIGAGEAAIMLLKELERSTEWRVVGLLDDKASLHGSYIHGVPVLGGMSQLEQMAGSLEVQQVIIALPSATHQTRQKVVHAAANAGVSVLTVPSFDDLMTGKVSISNIRKVEVEDLLGREPVVLDDVGLHAMIERRVMMVTGAGGSIGSELCRQIAKFRPSLLVLFEISEFALYRLEQEFPQSFPALQFACVVGDVKDQARVESVLRQYQPVVVFHAAAYKHVPMMENGNAGEALRNNVLGTLAVARACIANEVQKFVLISTDKAVNPTNVMGATKRLAEMVCQGLQGSGTTKLLMVRFGNVLGSSGSVIPKFREQIAQGGPVTVTHPEITRFFMSIPEAAQLVLQAGLMGQGGDIFVLDMGESVRIVDLAREMIRLSGFAENEIKISYTGLRPGEKLYEEVLADDEHTQPTPHPKLRIAQARSVDEAWVNNVVEWVAEGRMDELSVKMKLREWVGEYQPAQHDVALATAPGSSAIH
jgi:FlaA1/EpsC-like NDP-sugar epimerase